MERKSIRWSPILLGALIALALEILLLLLSGAGGLEIGAGIAGIALLLGPLAGGFLAARMGEPRARLDSVLQGAAVWAVVTVTSFYFFSSNALPAVGSLISQLGLGAGAATGMSATLEALSKMELRVVSDIHLTDGKIISRAAVSPPPEATTRGTVKQVEGRAEKLAREAEKKIEENRPELAEAAKQMKRASLAAFGALFLSLAGAVLGGWLGHPPSPSAPRIAQSKAA